LNDTHLLGLSWDEFQGFTAVPWNEAKICGLLKETPTAHIPLMFFKGLNCYLALNLLRSYYDSLVAKRG